MIKLCTFPPSTNSRKVRIALIEKGLEFERINIDLSKKEQKNPEYLKIHPFGQVPALDDEGFIIYDSTIINEYLEDHSWERIKILKKEKHEVNVMDQINF